MVKYIETGSVTKAEQFVTTEDLPDIELRNIIESKVGYFKKLHNINYVHVANYSVLLRYCRHDIIMLSFSNTYIYIYNVM